MNVPLDPHTEDDSFIQVFNELVPVLAEKWSRSPDGSPKPSTAEAGYNRSLSAMLRSIPVRRRMPISSARPTRSSAIETS